MTNCARRRAAPRQVATAEELLVVVSDGWLGFLLRFAFLMALCPFIARSQRLQRKTFRLCSCRQIRRGNLTRLQ